MRIDKLAATMAKTHLPFYTLRKPSAVKPVADNASLLYHAKLLPNRPCQTVTLQLGHQKEATLA